MRGLLAILLLSLFVFNSQANYRPLVSEISLPEEVRLESLDLLFVDRDDFIWLAAGPNLFWYDGFRFNKLHHASESPADAKITSFYQTLKGDIWVGWSGGSMSKVERDSLIHYQPAEGSPQSAIVGWAEDEDGRIWMATNGEGIYVMDSTDRWFHFGLEDGLPSLESYAIAALDTSVFVATDQGLVVLSFNARKKTCKVLGPSQGLPDQIVKALSVDEGKLWLGMYESFLVQLDGFGKISQTITAPGENTHQVISRFSALWWLDEFGDLHHSYAGQGWQRVVLDQNRRLKVRHIAADGEGHLWIATEDGLFVVNAWYEHQSTDQPVTAVAYEPGRLWYASKAELWRYDLASGTTSKAWSGAHPIISLHLDPQGFVWMGTFDQGVLIWNPRTNEVRAITEAEGLANNNVLSIAGDEVGAWMGTLGGVSFLHYDDQYDVPKLESFTTYAGRELQYIYKVHLSKSGEVYLATDGDGVIRWGHNGDPEMISNQVVLDVISDKQGKVWWVTSDGELFLWSKEDKVSQIPSVADEMGEVSGLTMAANGDVLLIHENGIHRWSIKDLHWTYYNRSFGLGKLRPELHAYDQGEGNTLYIGTAQGISILKQRLLPVSLQVATYLLGVELFFKPVSRRVFKHFENNISFNYIGKWYTDPDLVRYKVKLEGFDLDWHITKNSTTTYPRLPPGKYIFSVVAGINGRFLDSEIKSYDFVIETPWYTRWYSITLMLLALGLTIVLLMRARVRRLTYQDKLEKEKVWAQYESIKSQVNPHFLFNSFNTLMALIEEDPSEAREYLQDLSDFYRQILEFREVDLITVKDELEIISVYLQLQAKRFGDSMQLSIDIPDDVMGTLIPPLTLQLLVENAFKHNVASRKSPLLLKIYAERDAIVVWNRLHEKQVKEESTGYGLDGIKKKYVHHVKAPVKVEQSDDHFAVYLPFIKTIGA